MKRILVSLIATILGLIIGYTGYTYRANHLRLKLELQQTQQQKQELDNKLNETTQEKEQLKKQNDDLQIQLQAKKEQQAILASATRHVTHTEAPSAVIPNCGDNPYASYIYMHESGCRTHNPNGSGCDGIGQACPASKLLNPCGFDYACQNAWFNNYAKKYCYLGTGNGCWEGSYNFWVAHRWW